MLSKTTVNRQFKASYQLLNFLRWDNLLFGFLGFILAQSLLLGEIRPFAPAVLGAVSVWDKQKRWGMLAGSLLGVYLIAEGAEFWSQSIILLVVFMVLFNQFVLGRQQWIIIPSMVTAIVFIVNSIFIFFGLGSPYGWVTTFFESFFAGLITLVTLTSLGAWEKRQRNIPLNLEDKISCFILGLGVLLGFGDIYLLGVNIQSFLSRFAVLLGCFLGGPGGGAAVGTLVGLVPSIGGNFSTVTIGFYSLSGLLGGVFQGLGRIGILIGFTLGNLMLSMYFAGQDQVIMTLVETFLAGVVFLLTPLSFFRIEENEPEETEPIWQETEESAQKINLVSGVLSELSNAFLPTETRVQNMEENPVNKILDETARQVCDNCSLRSICWDKELAKTYRSLVRVCAKGEKNERISEQFFPYDFQRRCMRLRELSIALSCQLKLFKQEKYYQEKLKKSQEVVSRQLAGMAQLVQGFSKILKYRSATDEELAEYIKSELLDANINVQNVKVIENSGGDKEIVIVQRACPERNWCMQFIAPRISQIMDRTYTVKTTRCPTSGNKTCTYYLNPSQTYAVTTGAAVAIKEGSSVSGDNWSCLSLPDRKFALILSDGMGAGEEAYAESNTAVHLLEKLLAAGLGNQMAVDTVNSVLLLRSTKDSFATIDMTVINEVSATAEFIKIAACPSFIKRRTQVQVIKGKSLPIGILNHVEPEYFQFPVQVGDLIIKMSDGVFEALGGNIEEWTKVIQALPQEEPQNIANYLIELARKSLHDRIKDDLTVLVARIDYRSE